MELELLLLLVDPRHQLPQSQAQPMNRKTLAVRQLVGKLLLQLVDFRCPIPNPNRHLLWLPVRCLLVLLYRPVCLWLPLLALCCPNRSGLS